MELPKPIVGTAERRNLKRISKNYLHPDAGRLIDKKLHSYLVNKIIPWVKGPDVLELGVGDGEWTGRLLRRFRKSHIVDCVDPLLQNARKVYGSQVRTHLSLFEDFSPKEKFDTVLASFILEHVKNPIAILKKAKSWLKPNGKILIIVPNADSLHRQLGVCMGLQKSTTALSPADKMVGHRRVYTVTRMEKEIEAAGLAIYHRAGVIAKPLPQGMMTRFPDAVLHGLMECGNALPLELCASIAFSCGKRTSS